MFTKVFMMLAIVISSYALPDEKDAIQNYKEFKLSCVPKTLQDTMYLISDNDTTYIMQKDMNNIPWVVR